jgi:preprotein translocase subunit YajC
MFGLIAVLIFFMFRNGKKRQAAMQELQSGLRPGAEVMLQSGIFGTNDSIDEAENRVTLLSGGSTIVVHRNAVTQIVTPSSAPETDAADAELAPDDDPAFGERVAGNSAEGVDAVDQAPAEDANPEQPGTDDQGDEQAPKA